MELNRNDFRDILLSLSLSLFLLREYVFLEQYSVPTNT